MQKLKEDQEVVLAYQMILGLGDEQVLGEILRA